MGLRRIAAELALHQTKRRAQDDHRIANGDCAVFIHIGVMGAQLGFFDKTHREAQREQCIRNGNAAVQIAVAGQE